ncbi:MAG: hypothetical protein AVO34_11390 [Firmicutes bacterium ML8_F2]|jgi:tRNA(Leu) C34 or U34 (ribose-2'-O)-methylase TrmL|nr:MAG: hypothetical protein AVO34_11390 [Firmicutes bacterium ML8_F2]
MDLNRLESVIRKIRTVSTNEEIISPLFFSEKISSIKKAFQDYWRAEHLPLAAKIAAVIDKGIPTPVLTVCGRARRRSASPGTWHISWILKRTTV